MAWRYAHDVRRNFRASYAAIAGAVPPGMQPEREPYIPASWTWEPPGEDGEPAGWLEPEDEARARTPGYCGAAGKP